MTLKELLLANRVLIISKEDGIIVMTLYTHCWVNIQYTVNYMGRRGSCFAFSHYEIENDYHY